MTAYPGLGGIVTEYLARHGRTDLRTLQRELGFPRADFGNVPATNPLNATLVRLAANGIVTAISPQWGEPSFTLAAKP